MTILDIYKKSNLIIQSFTLKEVDGRKVASMMPGAWQSASQSYINEDLNGYLMNTGILIGDKYIIAIDIDNKDDKPNHLNGLTFFNKYIINKNIDINTAKQITGNNGIHYLFFITKAQYKQISANITSLTYNNQSYTIDIKCKNGCIFVEPTTYNNKKYEWEIKPIIENIQDIPIKIYDLILNHRKKSDLKKITQINEKDEDIIINNVIDFTNIKITNDNEKMIYLLNPNRFINFNKWINIAIVMKSLSFSLSFFQTISKYHYSAYNPHDVKKYWDSIKIKPKIQIALLHYLCKLDNPEEYQKLKFKQVVNNVNMDVIKFSKDYLIDLNNDKLDDNNCIISNNVNDFFNNHEIKSLNIKSPYDTGKTQLLKKIIEKYNPIKILFLSYRKTLTTDLLQSFKKYDFKDYQDGDYKADRLIIQLESLGHLTDDNYYDDEIAINSYDLVIIDEIESILCQYNSPTFKGKSKEIFEMMVAIIQNSNKLICLDGDMGERAYKFISNFGKSINIENEIKKNIKNYNITKNKDKFDKQIIKDLNNDKKIVIVSMSSKKCKEYYDDLTQKYKDKKILIYTGKTGDEEKQNLCNIVNSWKVDILIYSPTIEAGVNFDLLWFDKMYGIICNRSTTPRAFHQMMARIRKLQDNNIMILNEQFNISNLSEAQIKKVNFYSYDEVKQGVLLLDNINLTKCIIEKEGKQILSNKLSTYDENYIYNRMEQLNAGFNYFMPSFLTYCINKHHTYKILENEKKSKVDDSGLTINQLILNAEDINQKEYIEYIDNAKKNKSTEIEKRCCEKHSFKLLYGVDILDENILKVDKSHLKNFIYMIDINNINIPSVDIDNQTKEKILKITLIKDVLNNIGFNNVYSNEIVEINLENVKKSLLFNKENNILFSDNKKQIKIENNKQLLGYINKILINYSINIKPHRIRTKEQTLIYKYKLIRLNDIDEIINYKLRKGYKLVDNDNIRHNYKITETYKHLIDWNKKIIKKETDCNIMYPI